MDDYNYAYKVGLYCSTCGDKLHAKLNYMEESDMLKANVNPCSRCYGDAKALAKRLIDAVSLDDVETLTDPF